jgi:polyisoprenoid-binding protein YceI
MNPLPASEIPPLLAAGATLIHVLPEEHFAAEHLPGALNACVYEMSFVDTVREMAPDLDTVLIVYGAGGGSLDSAAAAAKLRHAGYSRVHDFAGGLTAWKADGRPLEGTGHPPAAPLPHGHYVIDPSTSVVRWTGRNLFNHHQGTVALAAGALEIDQGVLRSARFTLDMRRIACEDITDPDMNALLLRHLADEDFFDTSRHATAECVINTAEPLASATAGTPNYRLCGSLTLRGVTQPLEFPAVIAAADDDHLTGQAQFEIDRTAFGSHYGSGRLFAFLGRHVVNDHVHLHVKLNATRRPG